MSARSAKLIDRFFNEKKELIIRAERDGKYFNVRVSGSDSKEASKILGRGDVHFERRGRSAYYVNDAEWYGDDE